MLTMEEMLSILALAGVYVVLFYPIRWAMEKFDGKFDIL